jgi:carbonic anhydrase/acetyltransferase-like protein (isoleucine patch superfamily)
MDKVVYFTLFLALGFFLSYKAGYEIGERDIRRHTVVVAGAPIYRGVFFGRCARVTVDGEIGQACAVEEDR